MAIRSKTHVPPFSSADLEAICKILGDTTEGLTGDQINHALATARIPNPTPDITKWRRLFNAFAEFQNEHQMGNHVIVFITQAMNPVRYSSNPLQFNERKDRLNAVLAFSGFSLRDDGKIHRSTKVKSLDEALNRANRLQAALTNRQVHEDVLKFCKAELLQENFFHAVFEAMKSLAAKIRQLSGIDGDGTTLVNQAFAGKSPILVINNFKTETDRGEQRGFTNLVVGLFGTIRNPLAHNPKVEWNMSEQDTLDILTTLSLIHRKLDKARRTAS